MKNESHKSERSLSASFLSDFWLWPCRDKTSMWEKVCKAEMRKNLDLIWRFEIYREFKNIILK